MSGIDNVNKSDIKSDIKKKLKSDKPVNEKPVNDKPVNDKPVNDKPVNDKPVNEKSVNDKPVNEKPANDKPVNEKSVMVGIILETFNNKKFHEKTARIITKKNDCACIKTDNGFETRLKLNADLLDDIENQLIEFHKKCVKKNGYTKIEFNGTSLIIETKYGNIVVNFLFDLDKFTEFNEVQNINFNINYTDALMATDAPR